MSGSLGASATSSPPKPQPMSAISTGFPAAAVGKCVLQSIAAGFAGLRKLVGWKGRGRRGGGLVEVVVREWVCVCALSVEAFLGEGAEAFALLAVLCFFAGAGAGVWFLAFCGGGGHVCWWWIHWLVVMIWGGLR